MMHYAGNCAIAMHTNAHHQSTRAAVYIVSQWVSLPESVEWKYEHPRGCAQHDCLLYEPIAVLTLRHDVFAPFVC